MLLSIEGARRTRSSKIVGEKYRAKTKHPRPYYGRQLMQKVLITLLNYLHEYSMACIVGYESHDIA